MEKVKGDIISFMFYPPPPITRFVFNVSLTFAGGDSVAADPPRVVIIVTGYVRCRSHLPPLLLSDGWQCQSCSCSIASTSSLFN